MVNPNRQGLEDFLKEEEEKEREEAEAEKAAAEQKFMVIEKKQDQDGEK